MQGSMLKLSFIIFLLAAIPFCIQSGVSDGDDVAEDITWYAFEWLPSDEFGGLYNPRAIMYFKPSIESVSGLMGFQISLEIRDNYIYETAYNSLIWRRPSVADKVLSLHAAGTTRTRVLQDVEITYDEELIGYTDFKLIDSREEPDDLEISGFIGYDFFKSMNKILVIDHPSSRFACLERLPEEWEEKAHFVRMNSSPNFTRLRVQTNDRSISLSFDGMPVPALVLYRYRDYRHIVSNEPAADSLKYHLAGSRSHIMLDGRRPEKELYFGPYKLKSHDVYLMSEREHRISNNRGLISQTFFEDYILIIDFKEDRLGIVPPKVVKK